MFENNILNTIHESNRVSKGLKEKPIYRVIVLLQSLGLLITSSVALCKPECKLENKEARLESRKRHSSAANECYCFRCPKCKRPTTLQLNSFFSLFRKPLCLMVQIIKCWAVEMTISKTVEMLKIENLNSQREMVGRVFAKLRHVVVHDYNVNGVKSKLG